ncbi:MAG: flagellar hook-length control protein FliK, partial [Gammaproteobacteria bacterium]|nr:flagellar hook-length control protein FliK [Gammaproteobacteria bacterium]
GSDLRADIDSPFTALLETQVSFNESMELPAVIPLSSQAGSGEILPAGGRDLPPLNAEALPVTVPPTANPALWEATRDLGAAASGEGPVAGLEVELDIEYPAGEAALGTLPQVPLLIPAAQLAPKPTPAATSPDALDAQIPVAADKPLPPVELIQTAGQWIESPAWVGKGAEAAPVTATAAQALQNKISRNTTETPAIPMPTADSDPVVQDIPVAVPLNRAISFFETMREADTRVDRVKAPASATPIHIAATLSRFAGEATISRGDSMTTLIATPVRDSVWGDKLGERVMMLASNQIKSAEIRLTPADLGPLRIQVQMDEGKANVTFHAQHAVTREAIEQALPRLREMLAESGLTLGQANVSDRNASGDNGRNGGSNPATTAANSEPLAESLSDLDIPVRQKSVAIDGLIDTFA